jgi:hypothetical protein
MVLLLLLFYSKISVCQPARINFDFVTMLFGFWVFWAAVAKCEQQDLGNLLVGPLGVRTSP